LTEHITGEAEIVVVSINEKPLRVLAKWDRAEWFSLGFNNNSVPN